MWRVLHISDFHIRYDGKNALRLDEHARQRLSELEKAKWGSDSATEDSLEFPLPFLDGLVRQLEDIGIVAVDAIAATGDFVDAINGSKSPASDGELRWCFLQARLVLTYLARKLSVPPSHVLLCPGNHEISRDCHVTNKDGRLGQFPSLLGDVFQNPSRKRVNAFCDYTRLVRESDGPLHALSLDVTWNATEYQVTRLRGREVGATLEESQKVWVPGSVSRESVEEVKTFVEEHCHDGVLLVLAHFPVAVYDWIAAKDESEGDWWAARHVAPRWAALLDALAAIERPGRMLWLHGDIHTPIPPTIQRAQCISSAVGRFDDPDGSLKLGFHARCLVMDPRLGKDSHYIDLEFTDRKTFGLSLTDAEWACRRSKPFPSSDDERSEQGSADELVAVEIPPTFGGSPVSGFKVEDSLIQSRILEHRLYELRRVSCSSVSESDESAIDRLGHIRLGPILNDVAIFNDAMQRFGEYLRSTIPDLKSSGTIESVVVVGIDCWGAAMAAELGFRLGLRSLSLTLRGLTAEQQEEEFRVRRGKDLIATAQRIVLVTDIVVTGHTLHDACNLLERAVTGRRLIGFHALSVIAARVPHGTRLGRHGELTLASICVDLPVPVVKRTWLPNPRYLPFDNFGIVASNPHRR